MTRTALPQADIMSALVGQWQLTSFDLEFKDSERKKSAFGPNPNGRLIASPNSMLMVVITRGAQTLPVTDEDRAFAFNSMIAYSGRFNVEGDQLRVAVDISWNEAWHDTIQTRTIELNEPHLRLISAWAPSPADPRKIVRGILDWVREA